MGKHADAKAFWQSMEYAASPREAILPEAGDETWEIGFLSRVLSRLKVATVGVGWPYEPEGDELAMVEIADGAIVASADEAEEFSAMLDHMHQHGGCMVVVEPHRSYAYQFIGSRRVRRIPADTLRPMSVDDGAERSFSLGNAVDAPMMAEWLGGNSPEGRA